MGALRAGASCKLCHLYNFRGLDYSVAIRVEKPKHQIPESCKRVDLLLLLDHTVASDTDSHLNVDCIDREGR